MGQRGSFHKVTKALTLMVLFDINITYANGNVCPAPPHRKFRKALVCKNSSVENYSCLFDERSKTYQEACTDKPDFVRRGQKYVLRGGRDGVDCSESRFQPFNFWSNESSQCIFLKDACSELGLVVYTNGSTISDRLCRCDYKKGFIFVVKPQNRCYCIPSKEDCTCTVKECSTNEVLSPDYVCTPKNLSTNGNYCDHEQDSKDRFKTTVSRSVLEIDARNEYSPNIVRLHWSFLLGEIDICAMMSDLGLTSKGDRSKDAIQICSLLEKENIEKTLERFKKKGMYYIYRRLDTTQTIFRCTADASTLSQYIKGKRSWIISILIDRTNFEELLGILKARKKISSKEIACIVKREFSDIEIDKLTDTIMQTGKFAMLNFLDALCIIIHNKESRTENPKLVTHEDSSLDSIDDILKGYGCFKG